MVWSSIDGCYEEENMNKKQLERKTFKNNIIFFITRVISYIYNLYSIYFISDNIIYK